MILPPFLYRGVSQEMHDNHRGLAPKTARRTMKIYYGGSSFYGDGSKHGECEANAIVKHQRGKSTGWVSFSSNSDVAREYALFAAVEGVIYKIDTAKLAGAGVSSERVSEIANFLTKPKDEEYVLACEPGMTLPLSIVVEITRVQRSSF